MRLSRWLVASVIIVGLTVPASAKTYKVDKDHTSVTFTVRHLFSKITGRFDKFDGEVVFDPAEPKKTSVKGTIDVNSINTNVEQRDKHLKSPDFFDVAKYPTITFASTGVTEVAPDGKTGQMGGKLTIRGVEKPVVLDVSFLGEGQDPWGNTRAGFSASTKINRKDFGLNWNQALETGGVLVGDEIQITIEAEGMPEK